MSKLSRSLIVRVRAEFYILFALALMTVSLKWLIAWFLAATIHELGHMIMVAASGHRIYSLDVSWAGARICTDHLGCDEWYCALAGPMFGLLLGYTIRCFPRFALCAIFQSLVNLLPIYPLDGGRAVRGILCNLWGEEKASRISKIIGYVAIILIIVLISHLKEQVLAFLLITAIALTSLKMLLIKIPCKQRRKWVQ